MGGGDFTGALHIRTVLVVTAATSNISCSNEIQNDLTLRYWLTKVVVKYQTTTVAVVFVHINNIHISQGCSFRSKLCVLYCT